MRPHACRQACYNPPRGQRWISHSALASKLWQNPASHTPPFRNSGRNTAASDILEITPDPPHLAKGSVEKNHILASKTPCMGENHVCIKRSPFLGAPRRVEPMPNLTVTTPTFCPPGRNPRDSIYTYSTPVPRLGQSQVCLSGAHLRL